MTTMLKPAYELTLGSQRWSEQATRIRLTLALAPQVNLLAVWFPAAAPLAAGKGDDVELRLNSGEKDEVVFTGSIDTLRNGFDGIRVTCLDAGGRLAGFRPAVTYEQATAGTVIRNLAGEMGVATGDLEDGPTLPFYVADPSRTAWEHMARVSAWGGAVVSVTADNKVNALVIDASQAELALRYGREIIDLRAASRLPAVDTFTVAGEAGAGDAASPDVLRPSTDFFAGNRPEGPALGKRWRFEPALRTVKTAGTAGAARQRQYASGHETGQFKAFLQPRLHCGTVLEIQDLPERLPTGPIWVTRVEHWLGQGEASTAVRFRQGGDSFDPMALLGSLAGAIGGLV
jgi:hypothetical protein